MRTAIYARFSSALQKDSSIEDQVRVCRDRAEREGWTVTEVFTDYAISGKVRDRPGLNALLEHVRAGGAEQVLAEAIDRLSRDQEDQAHLFKRIRHAGGRIVTLSEGVVDELQIGFKGTMASLYTKDLAEKIRRGQTGRVAAGRIPGGIVYGYRKVVRLDARGEPERGLREIDPQQAEVVRRIYREYLAGESPLAIARRLNAEGVPSPSGSRWNVSAINGDTVRGNGILCNPIYAGELVYGRTTMVRDPDTRRRVPRPNPPDQWQRVVAPELAIVSAEEWEAVRERKAEWHGWHFHSQRRPKRLLSGLVRCGQCGGPMIIANRQRWGCADARRSGTCGNRRSLDNEEVEQRVFAGLRRELLSPERVSLAVRVYHDERARLERETAAAHQRSRSRLVALDREIARCLEAIATSDRPIPELVDRLHKARAEHETVAAAIGESEAARVIALHPNIAEAYRQAVDNIDATLAGAEAADAAEAREVIRTLIDGVVLTPSDERTGMTIDIEGRLQAMLALAAGRKPAARRGTMKGVAEERFGLDRTLCQIRA